MLGKTLSHYTITGTLGVGGMGTVYLAQDDRLGRTVALKTLSQTLTHDTVRRERFLREARAAAALKHPNVAQIYDVGEVDGVSFLVMEHVEGETLAERLGRSRLSTDEAIAIIEQACDAMAEAHGRDIVHRDLKPANLMLTQQDRVKILDFGLARQLDTEADLTTDSIESTLFGAGTDLTVDGQILGTVPYMSPEQARGSAAGPPSDVFSLGVVFYEMLAGRRPFRGESPRAIVESILGGTYAPVTNFVSAPAPLVRVVDRCLRPDPQDRYSNAHAMRNALRELKPASVVSPGQPANTPKSETGLPLDIETLAVMPFLSRDGNEETNNLGEGIAEGIVRTLSRLPSVRVLSRHASFALRDSTNDIPALGSRLGVEALVLGDLSSRGDRLVLNVELVATEDSHCIWGDQLECAVDESVNLEHAVIEQVTPRLQRALSNDDVTNLIGHKVHPQAYLLFLKGRPLLVGSAAQMEKGAEYLQQAIRLDPDFAIAHAVLAESYCVRASHGLVSVHEASRAARKAARAAVRLGPTLGESHTAAALVAHGFDWDWEGAEESFERAIATGSGLDMAYLEYSDFLAVVGRLDEALEMARKASAIDPVTPNPTHAQAYINMMMGNYTEAETLFGSAIELHPDWIWGHIKLGNTFSRAGKHQAALAEAKIAEARLQGRGTPLTRAWVGRIHAAAGNEDRAREILHELDQPETDPAVRTFVHSALGEREAAIACLEEAVARHSGLGHHLIPIAKLEPQLQLWDEPRFQQLLGRLGLG